MEFKILTLPNPILKKRAKGVNPADPKIQELTSQMKEFLARGNNCKSLGVGLAAPQIGQSVQIIIVYSKASRHYLPMLNPQILWHSKRTRLGIPNSKNPYEGCLSVPGLWGKVRRYSVIKLLYQTPRGTKVIRKFRGFTGVVVQHEIDHLEGILFTDRIKGQNGKLYQLKKNKQSLILRNKEGKDILEEIDINYD